MARQLLPGDSFPSYSILTAAGSTLSIPRDLKGEFGVIIFYRGVW
jgi:hypothetical protein